MTNRLRVGISRCLLGDHVRHDGTHRRDDEVLRMFSGGVEWVAVCPEVEVGMGTPREPIQLVATPDDATPGVRVRLVGVDSGDDWTDRMQAWARARVLQLTSLNLGGYILKAGSPSCGVAGVFVRHRGHSRTDRPQPDTRTGRGLFAQALMEAMPDLPVADEEELKSPRARKAFVAAVRARGYKVSGGVPV